MKEGISVWTLRFHNSELERAYQATRISYNDLPLLGRVMIYVVIIAAVVRRVQLFLDACCGSQQYSFSAELRATVEFLVGVALEVPFYFVNRLNIARGVGFTIGGYLSVIDSSCYYYPEAPALVPM